VHATISLDSLSFTIVIAMFPKKWSGLCHLTVLVMLHKLCKHRVNKISLTNEQQFDKIEKLKKTHSNFIKFQWHCFQKDITN
jgi:hypothetical protein